jgi:hypothetical protein
MKNNNFRTILSGVVKKDKRCFCIDYCKGSKKSVKSFVKQDFTNYRHILSESLQGMKGN